MTRAGDKDIEKGVGGGGFRKILDTRKGGSGKNCWARRGDSVVYSKTRGGGGS